MATIPNYIASTSAPPVDDGRDNSIHTIEANSDYEMVTPRGARGGESPHPPELPSSSPRVGYDEGAGGVGGSPPSPHHSPFGNSRASPRGADGAFVGSGDEAAPAGGSYLDAYIKQDKEEQEAKRASQRREDAQREAGLAEAEGRQRAGANETADAINATDAQQQQKGAAVVPIPVDAAAAAPLPKRDLDPSKPRTVAMTYNKEEELNGRQHYFDYPDPAFYLGAALLIGCICLFTWMAGFIINHGDIGSVYLWSITGGLTFFLFIGPFIYYCATSQHYHCCGKAWDGFCGAFPCAVAAFGIVFVEAFGIELIVNTALSMGSEPVRDEFLIFGTIPIFLLIFLPVFFAMIKFQDKASREARRRELQQKREKNLQKGDIEALEANDDIANNNSTTIGASADQQPSPPISSSGLAYLGVMMRRVVVGWVCGVCVAAHIALPAYALSWLAFGLYDLQREEGIWVIFVILIPPILLIIVLAIIPFTRPVPLFLWSLVVQYFWYPLMSWDPREGGLWYRYDNGLTYERLVNEHNHEVQTAERAYEGHRDEEAEAHYAKAAAVRARLDERGVKYGVRNYETGEIVPVTAAAAGGGDGGGAGAVDGAIVNPLTSPASVVTNANATRHSPVAADANDDEAMYVYN